MLRPRKADGSLPDINFMKLAPGSDLIDAGINVGLPFSGSAPDLGFSESGPVNSTDTWNDNSEFKNTIRKGIIIYPNPAGEFLNVFIRDPIHSNNFIRISNYTGTILYEDEIEPGTIELQIPIDLENGYYIVHVGYKNVTLFTQKLIVCK